MPAQYTREKSESVFWSKVNKSDGCWEWTGPAGDKGYGQHTLDGKHIRSHRASWIIHHGAIPEGLCVCHHCDNRLCVRPDHLFLGTVIDNNRDMHAKGRSRNGRLKGEDHWKARLKVEDVLKIRELAANGIYQFVIAEQFGISLSAVQKIVQRVLWKHV